MSVKRATRNLIRIFQRPSALLTNRDLNRGWFTAGFEVARAIYTNLVKKSRIAGYVRARLETTLERNVTQLTELWGRDALAETAWIARNLLELGIWTEWCCTSNENAYRFYVEALQDHASLKTKFPDEEQSHDFDEFISEEVTALLPPNLKLGKILNVSAIAEELGHANFASQNQMYSKFAHPTAMLVLTPLSGESKRRLQEFFSLEGQSLGNAALEMLRNGK
jgi:hypothetical protein